MARITISLFFILLLTGCDSLESQPIIKEKVTQETADYDVCRSLDNLELINRMTRQAECFRAYALYADNLAYCNLIQNRSSQNSCKDLLESYAINNVGFAQKLYFFVKTRAQVFKNPDICLELEDTFATHECMSNVAEYNKDTGLCNKIPDNNDGLSRRPICINRIKSAT